MGGGIADLCWVGSCDVEMQKWQTEGREETGGEERRGEEGEERRERGDTQCATYQVRVRTMKGMSVSGGRWKWSSRCAQKDCTPASNI